jgi:cytochrome P450
VGQVVDLEHFFSILAFKMFCRFAINHEFADSEVWSELTSRGSNIIGESIVLGIPVTTWIPRVKKLLEDAERFHRVCDPLIDARILALQKGEEMVDDPLTVMVQEKMTRKQMYSHLVTMLAAGHDTTAFCTCYTLFLLAKNPKIQAKLKAEVKRVLGNRTNITPEDISQLTYAKNCFQESLRIYSVVPHVTRVCIRDTKLSCGVTVPANTEVLVPICLLNRDTDEWGEPIDAFDPDRFEGITRESPSKGYFPFGYSTRSCIGATLALTEGTVMITLLAQRFTFYEEPSFKLKLKSGITMVSSNGVKVRVERDTSYASS